MVYSGRSKCLVLVHGSQIYIYDKCEFAPSVFYRAVRVALKRTDRKWKQDSLSTYKARTGA